MVDALLSNYAKTPSDRKELLNDCRDFDGQKRIGLQDQLSIFGNMIALRGSDWFLKADDYWNTANNNFFCAAIRSAPDIRTALGIITKYGHFWSPVVFFEKYETNNTTVLGVETVYLPESATVIYSGLKSLKLIALITVYKLLDETLKGNWPGSNIWLREHAPNKSKLDAFFACSVISGKTRTAIEIPITFNAIPSHGANPDSFRKSTLQIEKHLNPEVTDRALISSINAYLDASQNRRPTLGDLSRSLGMSSRTLNRRLEKNGVSFRQLLDHSLRKRTRIYLAQGTMSRGEIAERLGYRDQASFSRALQRWKLI